MSKSDNYWKVGVFFSVLLKVQDFETFTNHPSYLVCLNLLPIIGLHVVRYSIFHPKLGIDRVD
jgi:hypothetical protein